MLRLVLELLLRLLQLLLLVVEPALGSRVLLDLGLLQVLVLVLLQVCPHQQKPGGLQKRSKPLVDCAGSHDAVECPQGVATGPEIVLQHGHTEIVAR